MNYPSNSNEARPPLRQVEPDEKPAEKLVTGKVIRKKPPLSRRLRKMFFAEADDGKGVVEYIITDILVPAMKDMVMDSFQEGMSRTFYGNSRSPRRSRPSTPTSTNHVAYNRMSTSNRDRSTPIRHVRGGYEFYDIILATRADAMAVINELKGSINRYEIATVRELYESIGESVSPIDEKYGWSDLSTAAVRHVTSGYLLDLPQPEPIDE